MMSTLDTLDMLDDPSRETFGLPTGAESVRSDALRLVEVRPTLESRPTSGAERRAGRLRITRRGRLVLVVTVALLLLVAFSVGRVMSNAASSAPVQAATHTIVVAPGDTAWSLARAAMPKLDGRDAVDRLLALNHSDGRLQVGQTLVVPGS